MKLSPMVNLSLVAAFTATVLATPSAVSQEATMYKGVVSVIPNMVRVAGTDAFPIEAPAGGFTAEERAIIVERNVNNALISATDRSPNSVEIVPINNLPVIRIAGKHVVTVDSNSAKVAGMSMTALADMWAGKLKAGLANQDQVNTYLASLSGDFIPSIAAVPYRRAQWEAARLNHAAVESRALLPLDLKSSMTYKNAGMVAYMHHDYPAAADNFKKALQLNHGNAQAHYGLGITTLKLGQLESAVSELQMARWLEPDNALTHIALGQAFEAQGFDTAAIARYKEAIRLQPDNPEPYLAIADLREERNDIGLSVAELTEGVMQMPNSEYVNLRRKDQITWRLIRPY